MVHNFQLILSIFQDGNDNVNIIHEKDKINIKQFEAL